jgi:hypothetical protein
MAVVKHGVSTSTADRILIDAGAVYFYFQDANSPGTLLGATKGGNSFEITRTVKRIEPDGGRGPIKGFRRIEEVVAVIKANMLELTAENLRRALAGAGYTAGTTDISNEAVGTGNGSTKIFALAHGNVSERSEVVKLATVTKVRGTDYTMDYAGGKIQFFTAPGSGVAITCSYTYVSAAATIGGAEVASTAYVDNVAIVGTITGKTNPVIVKITNALCDAGFSIPLAPKNETVIALTFTAHYSNTDLTSEPYSIEYPAS